MEHTLWLELPKTYEVWSQISCQHSSSFIITTFKILGWGSNNQRSFWNWWCSQYTQHMSPMQLSCIGERKIQMHDWNSFTKFSSDARQLPMTHVLEVRTLHIYLSIIYIYESNIVKKFYFISRSRTFILVLSRERKRRCQPLGPAWICAHYTYMCTLQRQKTKFETNKSAPKRTNKWTVVLSVCHPPPPLELSSPLNRQWNRTKHYGSFLTDSHSWGFPCPSRCIWGGGLLSLHAFVVFHPSLVTRLSPCGRPWTFTTIHSWYPN